MADNIIVILFEVESEAYQAMSALKTASFDDSCTVSQAALVTKEGDKLALIDSFDTTSLVSKDTVKGTVIGGVVGLVLGPLGALVGAGIGASIGANHTIDEQIDGLTLFNAMATRLYDGETAVICLAHEESETAFDAAMQRYHAEVMRWNEDDVKEQMGMAKKLSEQL